MKLLQGCKCNMESFSTTQVHVCGNVYLSSSILCKLLWMLCCKCSLVQLLPPSRGNYQKVRSPVQVWHQRIVRPTCFLSLLHPWWSLIISGGLDSGSCINASVMRCGLFENGKIDCIVVCYLHIWLVRFRKGVFNNHVSETSIFCDWSILSMALCQFIGANLLGFQNIILVV